MKSFIAVVALLSALAVAVAHNKRVVCYYGSWSVYRNNDAKFTVEDINPNLCTHVIFSFTGLASDSKMRLLDPWNDAGDEWHEGAFTKMQKLKNTNPNIKIMVAIGGWNEGSASYSKVMNNPTQREIFVKSVVEFVKNYGFDGFDLDWEYPAQRGGAPEDKKAFSALIEDLRTALGPNYYLSAAVTANAKAIDVSYHCPDLSRNLDFVNVMAYDLHGSWEKTTGHNAPLHADPSEPADERHLNVETAMKEWIKCGVNPEKLNMGLATYGRSFTIATPNQVVFKTPATGAGKPGSIDEPGFLSYYDVCYGIKQNQFKVGYNNIQKVPFAVKDDLWVGYDDPESISEKTEVAKQMGLGGVMVWSIETDDFRGKCGFGKFPIMNAINQALNEGQSGEEPTTSAPTQPPATTSAPTTSPPAQEPTTRPPQTTTTEAPTTQPSNDNQEKPKCTKAGQFLKHEANCSKFLMCQDQPGGGYTTAEFICPGGLYFDETTNACNYKREGLIC